MSSASKVIVMVGTRKGGFIFTSDADRQQWSIRGPLFKGWNVMHMGNDPRDGRLHAAVDHFVYGPTTHYSDDLGETWTQARVNPALPRPSKSGRPAGTVEEAFSGRPFAETPEKLIKVWNITPGRPSEPGVLYAGVQPAALFKSTDRGESWALIESLYDHPQRGEWNPGRRRAVPAHHRARPGDPKRMYIAISAGGVYRTDDGGHTWTPRNKNVRADFKGEHNLPEFGQCVHKLDMHPAQPGCALPAEPLRRVPQRQLRRRLDRHRRRAPAQPLRLSDGRAPARPAHRLHQPGGERRVPHERRRAVHRLAQPRRRRELAATTDGLPKNAHLVVLRDAMAADTLDPAGIYAGTNTGQLFYSRDDGDSWEVLSGFLPPIQSVSTAVIE